MTELEKAQVWTALSEHTLSMDERKAPVVFSQYRTLYKAALKSGVKEEEPTLCVVGGMGVGVGYQDTSATKLLEEYKECLERYQSIITPIVDMRREGKDQIVLIVQELISNSTLLTDMKKQIKETINTATKDLAKEAGMTQIKAALASIQAEKATETSIGKIGDTLAAMQTKLEMLSSKLGNSTLGALAEQVNSGSERIKAMEASHEKLRESVDSLFATLRTHTTEVRQLQSNLGDSNRSLDKMVKFMTEINASVGNLTRERKLLTDEMHNLGEAYSKSTDEIKTRLGNVEAFAKPIDDISQRLEHIESSYATIENVREFVEKLDAEAKQIQNTEAVQPNTDTAPAARRRRSESPDIPVYARSARVGGGGGLSRIAQERGIPGANPGASPPRRPPFR